jgi:hypothetical protein
MNRVGGLPESPERPPRAARGASVAATHSPS